LTVLDIYSLVRAVCSILPHLLPLRSKSLLIKVGTFEIRLLMRRKRRMESIWEGLRRDAEEGLAF
jgi:hypothetical protein